MVLLKCVLISGNKRLTANLPHAFLPRDKRTFTQTSGIITRNRGKIGVSLVRSQKQLRNTNRNHSPYRL